MRNPAVTLDPTYRRAVQEANDMRAALQKAIKALDTIRIRIAGQRAAMKDAPPTGEDWTALVATFDHAINSRLLQHLRATAR